MAMFTMFTIASRAGELQEEAIHSAQSHIKTAADVEL